MSYDLFFRSKTAGETISRKSFKNYFKSRSWYELEGLQAWYKNTDTGVYFLFEYNDQIHQREDKEKKSPLTVPVSFNLNYIRPHVFGLEAEPEVAAFVNQFGLKVSDPQMNGMGNGKYSKKGFLSGWNAGNQSGYMAIQDSETDFMSLPASQINKYWQWNYSRQVRQKKAGDNIFVPKIFFFNIKGKVKTGVAWADGIPIILPVVDYVLVPREKLAPRKRSRSRPDMVMFTWAELKPIMSHFRHLVGSPGVHKAVFSKTPVQIIRLIQEKKPPSIDLSAIAFDEILDEEMLVEAKLQ